MNIGKAGAAILQVSAVFPTKKAFSSWAESQVPFKCIAIGFQKKAGSRYVFPLYFILFLYFLDEVHNKLLARINPN